ncbi:MAG: TonB-dependent receptor [Bacteroidales bacterium]|jgi:TonB-linked SusC/RagA family outer membrane protein|nr:TonB-dependent receptor [Bacteroidales bacterium]
MKMYYLLNGTITKVILLAVLLGQFISVSAENRQTDKNINGVVLDVEGQPLAGVTIVVKGTATGNVTDAEGKYSIRVSSEARMLVFSYVGYQTQEIEIGDRLILNIVLREATQEMEGVVVIGYGTQKKVSVTGALSTISMKNLTSIPVASFSNALGGQLPGIITRQGSGEPGFDGAQLYIRGMSTFTGTTNPLVLVDGVERDINLVNPQEVESFSLLKDASATAVYGVRGANGVILITTKKGKMGRPKVTLRTEWAQLRGMRFPNYIEGWEFASLMNEASEYTGNPLPWTEEEIEKFRTGSDPYLYPNVNWTDEVYKKTSGQSVNNLSVTGGGETVRYYVSAGYTAQSGLYNEDKSLDYRTNAQLNRFNFRSNVDINVYKDLVIDLGLAAIIQNRTYQGTAAQTIYDATKRVSPIDFPVRNPDGSIGGTAGADFVKFGNPWALTTQSGYTNMYVNTVQGTFGAKWDLSHLMTKGLSLSAKFSFDAYNFSEIFRRIAFGTSDYLGPDPVTGEDRYAILREPGTMGSSVSSNGNRSTYLDAGLNYERTFDRHSFMGVFLFNRREYVNVQATSDMANIPQRWQGLAGRLAYDFDKRYLFEFNFGYNGSENFPKGKRYGFFPSVSAGWIVSNEAFWGVDAVSQLKIRGSHGLVGNDQIGGDRFLYLTTINKNAAGYAWGTSHVWDTGMTESKVGAENVTWETSTKSNVGLDLGFWDNKITLQVDAFHELRDGILVRRQVVPQFAGYLTESIPWGNVGKVENRGIDGMLEIRNTTSFGLYYSFRGNFSFSRNKILEDDKPEQLYPYLNERGNRIGQYFGLEAIGFFKDDDDITNSPKQTFQAVVKPGDIKYKNQNPEDDDVIDDNDRVPIGYSVTPEIMFGFGGTLAYKGFDLTVYFNGVTNRSIFLDGSGMMPYELEYPSYNVFREYYDHRWIPGADDNAGAKYPAVIAGKNPNNYRLSTMYMRDASYLRLQNAEIGWTAPQRWTEKIKMESIRFFINGNNLYVWDKIKIMDPEMQQTGSYPRQRIMNVGAQVNF